MGKATADITFNPDAPPEAYSNSTMHSRISSYCESARGMHGPDFDPYTEAISGEAAMRAGGGKAHGRHSVANCMIDPTTTPSLAQIRAKDRREGSSSSGVRPRIRADDCIVANLQTQLAQRDSQIAQLQTQYSSMEGNFRDLALYVQQLGANMAGAPPPTFFVPPAPAPAGPSPHHSQAGGWSGHINPTPPNEQSPNAGRAATSIRRKSRRKLIKVGGADGDVPLCCILGHAC